MSWPESWQCNLPVKFTVATLARLRVRVTSVTAGMTHSDGDWLGLGHADGLRLDAALALPVTVPRSAGRRLSR